jgi:hypothetical protein
MGQKLMKIFKSIAITLCVVLGTSCSLDLREDPNAVQPDQALPNLLLTAMQVNLSGMFNGASTIGMTVTRLQNAGQSTYDRVVTPQTVDGIWSTAYAAILQDANTLIPVADENGYARHAGVARIISAYTIMVMVDYFGDVPFSEAFQGSANFNPALDDDQELYAYAISLLDQAKLDLSTNSTTAAIPGYLNPVAPSLTDLYYANNYAYWIRLANTLKLRAYVNMGDAASITALVAEPVVNLSLNPVTLGGFITTPDQNFAWRYATNTSSPDTRHPRFTNNYLAGGGDYMSNYLMWQMYHGYDATSANATVGQGDPRMRFYFYRQTLANSTNSNEIRCLGESMPNHFPTSTGSAIIPNSIGGIPPLGVGVTHPSKDPADPAWGRTFCYPTDKGYWGRDHVDPQGIPPDNLLRTAWGVYPAGGRFDANNGAGVSSTQGMRGAGLQPIMMRSFTEFMLAEANLVLGATTGATAAAHFDAAVRASFADVRDWAVTGKFTGSPGTAAATESATIGAFYPSGTYTTDVNNYMTAANAAFAAEGLNYLAREYWIASFGNGIEAYNLYRRTGMPTGMQPVINPQPGIFPRSFWYPANAANLNSSIDQKADESVKVFWDQNGSNLDF